MPTSQVQRAPPKSTSPEIPVVAIGASAGGLEALTAILRALPTDIDMAFMLIQHLDPKRHSILPELLSKATRIPVLEAINAMKIESNRVYVMVIRLVSVSDQLDLPEFNDIFCAILGWSGDLGYLIRVHGQEFNSFHRKTRSKGLARIQTALVPDYAHPNPRRPPTS
jgi:hypothetical protein